MKHILKIIFAAGTVFLFIPAKNGAQNLQSLTLENAVALAHENNPALRTFAVEEQITNARLTETKLQRGIKLNAGADAQVNPFLPASFVPVGQFDLQNPTDETRAIRFGTWWQAALGVTASKTLFDASLNAQLREQEFRNLLTANDLEQAKTNVSLEVARAYYAILLAEEEIRYLESDLNRANSFLTDAEQRQSGGAALIADVNSARLQLNDAQLRLEQALENRDLARKNLLFHMGLPLERVAGLTLGETLTAILEKIESAANDRFDPAAAEQNRPDLRQLVLDNRLQSLKIETEKSRLKPTLSASAFLGMNNFSDKTPLFAENSWFSNGNVALRLNVPLSGHWELKKHTLPLSLKQQQNDARLDDLRRQLRFEFESARSAYTLAKRQMPIRRNDIALAQANLDLARAKYGGGGGLASDVTEAETALQQKQFAWLQTAFNLLLAELNMRQVRGELK